MFTNVNLSAPVGALALMGTSFMFLLAAVAFVYTLVRRRFQANKRVVAAAAALAVIYVAVLLLFSFTSSEQTLARGQEKHFCEIDCHLAYSVVAVTESKTLGTPPQQATAAGTFHSVTIKTRFDENTIGPTRGNGLLYPNGRVLTLIDEQGRHYIPSSTGQVALEQSKAAGTPFTTPLRPGEAYTTTVVFDVPAEARGASLLINEAQLVTHFVIGHENSPLHKQAKFQL